MVIELIHYFLAIWQTPASKLKDQVSTGHADSPATIIVGRAHRQKFAEPTGAAPRWISNVGLLKKDMKMDEDFTGNCQESVLTKS